MTIRKLNLIQKFGSLKNATVLCMSTRASEIEIREEKLQNSVSDWNNAIPYSEVPGPKPLPFLGNIWRFLPYIGEYSIDRVDKVFQNMYKRYGTVVKISGLFSKPDMLLLYDPDEISRVFKREDAMPYRPSPPSLNYYKHILRKDFFGDDAGVIAVHGENWHNFRLKVQQVMLQPSTARMYIKQIEETASEFVERSRGIKNEFQEMPNDYLNYIHKWSLESIARVALDVRLGCLDLESNPETQAMIDAVNTFFLNISILELKTPFWRLFSTPTWREYIRALDTIREISMKHINAAVEKVKRGISTDHPSLLHRVITMDPNAKIASILALDMFLVGIDTTSNAVASVLYQLSIHPDKQEKLYNEISSVLPSTSTPLTGEFLDQMQYLRACIKETMRMFPVVILNGRCTTSDSVIGGYQIPKGVQIVFQHYVLSNLDKYFTNSNQFLPERWLRKKTTDNFDSEILKHHRFASLPFGHGRRMCLGRRFADLEMQIVIAKMIQAFRIEYHHKKLDYHTHPMFTPNGPLKLRLINR